MKITLINPPQLFSKTQVAAGITPPMGLLYLSAFCKRHDYSVEFIDSVVEAPNKLNKMKTGDGELCFRGLSLDEIIKRINPDSRVVGISNLFSFAYLIVSELSRLIKQERPDAFIVIGGAHASAMPKDVLGSDFIDFVVTGEGELTFVDLLNKLKHNNSDYSNIDGLAYKTDSKIKVNPRTRYVENLDALPFPDRDIIDLNKYYQANEAHGPTQEKWTPIISSRGCPFHCTFCTSSLWNRYFRARSAKNVVDEIEECMRKYAIKEFHFEDENFTLIEARVWEICDEIKKRGLKIKWQTPNGIRASVTKPETLKKMKQAGCYHVTFAPESGSPRVLDEIMQKQQNLAEVTKLVKFSHKINLNTCAYFILGTPKERKEDIGLTIKYAAKLARLGLDEVAFSLFVPLPGSVLYEYLKKNKALINDWKSLAVIGDIARAKSWSEHISDNQLNKLRTRAYLFFYLNKIIFHPIKVFRTVINVLRKKQTLKTERVLITFLKRLRL